MSSQGRANVMRSADSSPADVAETVVRVIDAAVARQSARELREAGSREALRDGAAFCELDDRVTATP
ncbi:hypothetical protein SZN_13731 [Streptomyces zinciresistens K42]|uniref:Uncharacterized protein n=1 Tax=Streptomyces zinciresistens K42 TaxID=700597 RepID=G2GB39_9ACTN|nr:hypothetical protein SZN_13731 [Streptomyces zinciresistens K42]